MQLIGCIYLHIQIIEGIISLMKKFAGLIFVAGLLFSACSVSTISLAPSQASQSGIKGKVLLGPTCPVMRNPPDPQCAEKPYQTQFVLTTPDQSQVIKEFSSDTQGKFSVDVPAGAYFIRSAPGAKILPRCSNASVTVTSNTYANVIVSCDTGIR